MASPGGVVSLTTDFGLSDTYVGQLHAALLQVDPTLQIVDLSHDIEPGAIESTLFHTECAWGAFPDGSVHLVIVDPGVGSDRGIVLIQIDGSSEVPRALLVGPDTGVLSSGLPASMRRSAPFPVGSVRTVAGVSAVEVTESPVRDSTVSSTFHGRDIMAPVAAHAAAGQPLTTLGRPVDSVVVAPRLDAAITAEGGVGRVVHVDRFGNAITNIRSSQAPRRFRLQIKRLTISGPAMSYLEGSGGRVEQAVAIGGSCGFLEIATFGDSAAVQLGLSVGDTVTIVPDEPR